MAAQCEHLDQIKPVTPSGDTCAECAKDGTKPVALRMCLSCGHIGCCDSSIGRHARKHYEETGHAIMESFRSAPAGQKEWRWCYIDDMYL